MTAVTNFMKNNVLFWLLPPVLLVVKLVFDLIPYKPLFFSLTFVIIGITAFVIKKNRLDMSIMATRELLEFEFEDEDDISKYGAKSAEDRKRKVCDNLSEPFCGLFLCCDTSSYVAVTVNQSADIHPFLLRLFFISAPPPYR